MRFQSSEDRLNPIPPEGVDDTTLGGYPLVHGRAPAFEGCDGEPYTVAIDTERAEDGEGWVAYLIFLRWSQTGSAVMGHMETGDLERGATEEEARKRLEAYPLRRVREVLDAEIERRRAEREAEQESAMDLTQSDPGDD
ncbi:MAG TPA: hypothetical protein VF167_14695 [Longimicrobiaceae bacterium]